jgi:hypothetical protein
LSVPDEDYSNLLTLSVPDEGYSNLLTLSVPDEDYSNLLTLSGIGSGPILCIDTVISEKRIKHNPNKHCKTDKLLSRNKID